MKDLSAPPEPAFSNWCAEQANPPSLCYDALGTAGWAPEVWILLCLFVVLFVGFMGYVVWFSRRAYLGGRYCDVLGGYEKAAAHLDDIEAVSEARLQSGIQACARFNPERERG